MQLDFLAPASVSLPVPSPSTLRDYDVYVCFFSGGKDSEAKVLQLLEWGIPPEKIELHHHLVDGNNSTLFDWPCTTAYVQAFARELGLRLYLSWREGGLERELLKEEARTARVYFETPSGEVLSAGGGGEPATRRKYPQQSASLATRWCSGVAKIDVGRFILTHDPRFQHQKTLVLTGERAEESPNRATYPVFQVHDRDLRAPRLPGKAPRHIDHFRPLHGLVEKEVWAILQRWGVQPHPAYMLGFSRCSCMTCIFLLDADWRRLYTLAPAAVERHMEYEEAFGLTIDRARKGLRARIANLPEPTDLEPRWIQAALSKSWNLPIRIDPEQWTLPLGAFRHSGGPS